MIKHVVGGIPVTDETLAVEDIAKVGAFGDFLSLDSTMKFMRMQSQPTLIDRRVREDWEARGSTDLYQRSLARAREILKTHQPQALPDETVAAVRKIVADADRAAGVTV
jgi:trimethylamine--corrinoid protein Co-methyltransferase